MIETFSGATEEKEGVQSKNIRAVVSNWWAQLNNARKPRSERWSNNPFDSGDSAVLRRCKTLDEIVLQSQAFHTLRKRLNGTAWAYENNIGKLALVAGVLSHIREQSGTPLPEVLASLNASDEATTLRFQRTIQYKTPEELFRPMVRLVTYLEKAHKGVYIAGLAQDLYFWNDDTRKQWAIAFYKNLFGSGV